MHSFFMIVVPVWFVFMAGDDGHGIIATISAIILSFIVGFAIDCFDAWRKEKLMPVPTEADCKSWQEQRALYEKPRRHRKRHRS